MNIGQSILNNHNLAKDLDFFNEKSFHKLNFSYFFVTLKRCPFKANYRSEALEFRISCKVSNAVHISRILYHPIFMRVYHYLCGQTIYSDQFSRFTIFPQENWSLWAVKKKDLVVQ